MGTGLPAAPHGPTLPSRAAALLAVALLTAGCGSFPSAPAPVAEVEAPRLLPGDRWEYRQINPYNGTLVRVLTDSLEPAAQGFTIVRQSSRERDPVQYEAIQAPWQLVAEGGGPSLRRYSPPLARIRFPIRPGATWNQSVRATDARGTTYDWLTDGTVLGWEQVPTPGGTFVALKIRLQMNLGDGDAEWGDTHVFETLWYAPEVKRWVRREYRYERIERAFVPRVERDWELWELRTYAVQ